jgi:hypothetical protein
MGSFGTVLIVISVLAVLAAAASYWGAGGMYRRIGREGGLDMGRERAPVEASSAEAQEEIRQLLEAKSARREARGERPLDVDAELASLMGASSPAADLQLRTEVRQLVVARNERLLRQGREPLDVEAEVERQLRELNA